MKFFDWLSSTVMTPVESITQWFDDLNLAMSEWFGEFLRGAVNSGVLLLIEAVACFVVCYSLYCACRIMCCDGSDEKFSEYSNKTMLACVTYFFARYGGNLISHYLMTVGG